LAQRLSGDADGSRSADPARIELLVGNQGAY
jgi:hypothetical protein